MNSTPTRPGRKHLWLGIALAIGGIAAFIAQVSMAHLKTPWYLPVTGTLAFVLVAYAIWQARGIGRAVALLLMFLIAGAEWGMTLGFGTPTYAGPIAEGKPFPTFAALKADGSPFSQRELEGDADSIMVFFRGHW